MHKIAMLVGAGLVALGGAGAAQAQSYPVSGTPGSPFPYAAPHEVEIVNGVPCRTVLDHSRNVRVPVACAGTAMMGDMDPVTTGSIVTVPARPVGVMMGQSVSGTPDSIFPYAAPHEIRYINGVPCRTVLDGSRNVRVPVQCAQ